MIAYHGVYKGEILVLIEKSSMIYLEKESLIRIGYQYAISDDKEVLIDTVFNLAKSTNDFNLIGKLNELLDISSGYSYSESQKDIVGKISKSIFIERIVLTAIFFISIASSLYKPSFFSRKVESCLKTRRTIRLFTVCSLAAVCI
ncbi:hypothetical protein SAMN02745127_02743 [Oceanospirillum multiglobuliferum]|uniref:Uncharacterized protein n=1 Tax=Oceanospirillum multiglobuliferum TaxID=64969 RepID=A0A1T4S4I1_9GAMM|nr:hypothetical protein [Oceanospirillum multiglobuliferum]OPX54431.1 hypothetical protein BTE48_14025 [Oceanospirillum multiglobuliferum]SKA23199.1 hypothetical protein SAMN02745127_02743 [Oceanospirillum multiglobuliferum]